MDTCYGHKCDHGYCNPTKGGYECQCKHGFKGQYCRCKSKSTIESQTNPVLSIKTPKQYLQ